MTTFELNGSSVEALPGETILQAAEDIDEVPVGSSGIYQGASTLMLRSSRWAWSSSSCSRAS